MKKLFAFLLLSYPCFSQQNFTTTQIDSIANGTGEWYTSDIIIQVHEDNKHIGKGGASLEYCSYIYNESEGQNLSTDQEKKINTRRNSLLIKGTYQQSIHYKDDRGSELIFIELYYSDNKLFFVKAKTETIVNGESKVNYHELKVNDNVIPNTSGNYIANLVEEKNKEIIKLYNENHVNTK